MAKFAEVLSIINGKNQGKVENPNGRYPIYGSGGIMGYADEYICEAETVIIGRKGTINKPIFVETPFWNVDTAFGLYADRSKLIPKYLYYFCQYFDFEALNTTVTIPSLTKANLLNVEINLPPLNQQVERVDKLDRVCGLINLHKRQLAKLDELVKARFVELFGDPHHNPYHWDVKRFDAICENLDSRRIPITESERKPGIYPYYGASGIIDYVDGYLFDEDLLLISEDGANLIARVTPIAFSVAGKVWVNNHAHVVRFQHYCTQKYIEILFSLMDISNCITGTAQPKLNQAKLNAIKISVPPIALQEKFSAYLSQINQVQNNISASLAHLETLKASLMQEYFGRGDDDV